MATTLMSLKLFVDKEMNRVVFAESGNDFVDVLLSFLTLPIGTIIGLTGKQSKIGSMTRLYESVEDLDVNLLQAEACKDMLLHPRSASEEQCKNLKVNVNNTNMTKYYICSSWSCCSEAHQLISSVCNAPCRCGRQMNQVICKKPPKVVAEGKDGVFVKGDVIYMISDDLQVSPVSTASALSLLKDLGIGLRTTFEEHNVRVSAEEVLHLLERSLFSKTPLTDMFLGEQDIASTADHNSIATLNSSGHGMAQSQMEGENDISSERMSIKLIQNKFNHRIFYAETGTDFPDLLFSFLTFPLGAILKCLVITLLSSYNMVMNDIEERVVNVGVLEAISLLKASLISNTVLTDVFSLENPIPKKIGYYRRMVASTINKAIEDGILHEDNYSNN
ncbi:hypothetical protein AAC387_Pa12g1367 [Persea americana]